ncbi:MAG: ABC transporter substrate-binding protein [Oscillospiraceae bacterium]
MKKSTKIITAILAVVMLMSLTACGPKKSASGSDIPETSPKASAAPVAEEFTTATEGTLTMATNAAFPPYEFYEGDKIVGIDAEIAGAIAEKLGLKLEIQDMEFDTINVAVNAGKADIGFAGMTVTPERLEAVNFTTSYATGVQVVIVAEGSKITSVDDLFAEGAKNTIGVQRGTTGDIYTSGDIEEKGLGTIDRYGKGVDAIMALNSGKVDCVVIDNEPAKAFVAENKGLKILDTEYVTEDYAASVSKKNEPLLKAVDGALKELIADGTIKGIIEKYIPTK